MFLARKVSLAKWSKKDELAEGEIPADAVTADLRTQDNKLSFWRCGNGEGAVLQPTPAAHRYHLWNQQRLVMNSRLIHCPSTLCERSSIFW